MNNVEQKIIDESILFAKQNKKRIADTFTDITLYPADDTPVCIIMAGSPGAGKTEFSKRLIEQFKTSHRNVIRIDPDDFRPLIDGYTGVNSYLFQGAVSIITDRILDNVFHKNQSFILDGTCSHYGPAAKNIKRAFEHNRFVFLFFVYQHPKTAWEFTQKRELKEGRNISKDVFIEEFLYTQETVMKLKDEFKDKLFLNFVDKEILGEVINVYSGIDSIYDKLPQRFTKDELYSIIK